MRYLPFLLLLAFSVYTFVDCLQTPAAQVRRLPKGAWLLLTWFPLLGGLGWLVYGRARGEARHVVAPPVAPDDDPDFLRSLHGRTEPPEDSEERLMAEWEDDLRRDDGEPRDPDGQDRP